MIAERRKERKKHIDPQLITLNKISILLARVNAMIRKMLTLIIRARYLARQQ